jgi:uncharacterized membrane protein
MRINSKSEAQQRVDQIGQFQAELRLLEQEAVLSLDEQQRRAVEQYHGELMAQLAATFDVDSSLREKRLSLGMKIASFLGALGLAASLFFLFYQFWGFLSTGVQVVILVAAPFVGMAATIYFARREKTGYFSKLAGLATIACFVLNLSMLGQIFNITPSPNAFLVWALFAVILAYASDARLLLAAGILAFAAFLSAKVGTWSGCYWIYFGVRPENFFPAAVLIFLVPLLPHTRVSGFAVIYRVLAMLLLFLPMLVLANWGAVSYLTLDNDSIEVIYQIAGFVLSAAAIWLGIRKGWQDAVNTGNVFFTIFLYTKFFDWWWDLMPKYLFFLVVALTAILMLLVFKRLRDVTVAQTREVTA